MESRMTVCGGGECGFGVEGLNKKEKGLMDVDNSLVMEGGGRYKEDKW